jgi:uncharacterized protein (UPF0305 family)
MKTEQEKVREFTDLIERRYCVRLPDAEAHALWLRLTMLYRVLVRKPPADPTDQEEQSVP